MFNLSCRIYYTVSKCHKIEIAFLGWVFVLGDSQKIFIEIEDYACWMNVEWDISSYAIFICGSRSLRVHLSNDDMAKRL